MKSKALRMYGKNDLRLEEFPLPPLGREEILVEVVCNSVCMSDYKAAILGSEHKKVPKDIGQNPVIIGHELSGRVCEVGRYWQDRYEPGERVCVQPAFDPENRNKVPGYSYHYFGGNATFVIVPGEIIHAGCLLTFEGPYYFGSLAEPLSCIIGAFHAQYHRRRGTYAHEMGIKSGGAAAILGGAGPMGLGAVGYALFGPVQPRVLCVTDTDRARLARLEERYPRSLARDRGVSLETVWAPADTRRLMQYAPQGYDDVFVMGASKEMVRQADEMLGEDGCLNFFAGPTQQDFSAPLNFYRVHYYGTHIAGTSGGNREDMQEALELMQGGLWDPSCMVTHIGGLSYSAETTLSLPFLPGGKKLLYMRKDMPCIPIDEMAASPEVYGEALSRVLHRNRNTWSAQAEEIFLKHPGEWL
ncbi:MAG: alcohol dehydrogenase catalytic domain-containing protein [Christensenellales bacterium]|jgi:threonine dehydrogenase-like Zn-dependent dehydrogenase